MIKVLMNALSARQGGGQTYVTNVLSHLPADFDAEIHVLAPDSLRVPTEDPRIRKVPVKWPTANPFARAVWEKLQLPALLSELGADVLFCPGGIVGCRAPGNCKTVTMFRNMIPLSDNQARRYAPGYMRVRNFLLKRALLKSMREANLVIFLCDHAKSTVEGQLGTDRINSITIPHGVADSFRRGAASKAEASRFKVPAEGYLLYVSTLDFYKDQIEVVQAYALLREKRDTREKLVLAGPEYPEYGRLLRKQIRALDLEDSVLLTGPIPHAEMGPIYANALLNIFASECENCPNILIEALAAGRPVLSSDCPPMPEFGGDGAIYFDPKRPEQLSNALAALLDDPALMAALALRAEERSRLYDWNLCSRRTWQAIGGLARS